MSIAMQRVDDRPTKVLDVMNNVSVAMIFATTSINVVVSSFMS